MIARILNRLGIKDTEVVSEFVDDLKDIGGQYIVLIKDQYHWLRWDRELGKWRSGSCNDFPVL